MNDIIEKEENDRKYNFIYILRAARISSTIASLLIIATCYYSVTDLGGKIIDLMIPFRVFTAEPIIAITMIFSGSIIAWKHEGLAGIFIVCGLILFHATNIHNEELYLLHFAWCPAILLLLYSFVQRRQCPAQEASTHEEVELV